MSELLDLDAVMERFAQWVEELRAQGGDIDLGGPPEESESESTRPFGLVDLVEEFTALRHELKLQTKSTRGLQDQTEALLTPLRQAIEQFRSVSPREDQAAWTAGKPLAEGLATLDEALDRCRLEIERARSVASTETANRGYPGPGRASQGPVLVSPPPVPAVP